MNIVIFETAKRLKEAGLPQPDSACGTFWYVVFNDGTLKSYHSAYGYMASIWLWDTQTPSSPPVMANPIQWEQANEAKVYFAPSATDILKELDFKWSLYFDNHTESYFQKWGCVCDGRKLEPQYHENPAEACAAAWLSIHEKSANQ